MGATPACNATSRLFRVCSNTVWRAVQAAKMQRPMNNCKKQLRKSWKNLDDQTQTIIRQVVRENLLKKSVTLEAMLQELMNILPDFPYGRSTFAKIVRSMGFKFSRCKELQVCSAIFACA